MLHTTGAEIRSERTSTSARRPNSDLSERPFAEARQQLDGLLAERHRRMDSLREAKTRELLGHALSPTASDLLARRDADERAAKLEDQQAAVAALERAELSGDRVLSRAIALEGIHRGWPQAVQKYRTASPASAAALDVIAAIDQERSSGLYGMHYALSSRL